MHLLYVGVVHHYSVWYGWDFSVCLWFLPHTCFAQIARPSATRFISVFDDGGNEVLSVNVSTTTAVIYSGDTVTITTSTSFFTNRTYYLLADSGVCLCVWSGHVFMWTDGWAGRCVYILPCIHVCLYACQSVMPAFTIVYTWMVLAGVAVAVAFCPIELAAVSLPTEWPCMPICHACLYHCMHLNCTCRCCCCCSILPNWVSCRLTSYWMAIWSHWRFVFCSTFICLVMHG